MAFSLTGTTITQSGTTTSLAAIDLTKTFNYSSGDIVGWNYS